MVVYPGHFLLPHVCYDSDVLVVFQEKRFSKQRWFDPTRIAWVRSRIIHTPYLTCPGGLLGHKESVSYPGGERGGGRTLRRLVTHPYARLLGHLRETDNK